MISLFEIVIAIAVQSAFYLEMHQDDRFSCLKKKIISTHQNDLKTLKNINFKN
jgi:hypothetical protein